MSRILISREDYDKLDFDHAEATEDGRVLCNGTGDAVGRLYYEESVTESLRKGTLEYEAL